MTELSDAVGRDGDPSEEERGGDPQSQQGTDAAPPPEDRAGDPQSQTGRPTETGSIAEMRGPEYEEKIERLAKKLLHGGDGNLPHVEDIEAARRAARRILEESEARTFDEATLDPDNEGVIRRSSGETAATGETGGTRRVSEGD